jgi:hypothetical protein
MLLVQMSIACLKLPFDMQPEFECDSSGLAGTPEARFGCDKRLVDVAVVCQKRVSCDGTHFDDPDC